MTYFSCALLLLSYLFCTLILNHNSNDFVSKGFSLNLSLPRLYSSLSVWFVSSHLSGGLAPLGKEHERPQKPHPKPCWQPPPAVSLLTKLRARSLHQSFEMRWRAWGGVFLPREPLLPWGFIYLFIFHLFLLVGG